MRNARRGFVAFGGVVVVGGHLAHAQRQTPAAGRGRGQAPATDGAARGGCGAPGRKVYTEDAYLGYRDLQPIAN